MLRPKLPRRWGVAVTSSLLSLVALAATLTVCTSLTYARSCTRLTGYPGFLQRAGLVAAGPCPSKPGGMICSRGLACITVDLKAGTCMNVSPIGQPANCQCVENLHGN